MKTLKYETKSEPSPKPSRDKVAMLNPSSQEPTQPQQQIVSLPQISRPCLTYHSEASSRSRRGCYQGGSREYQQASYHNFRLSILQVRISYIGRTKLTIKGTTDSGPAMFRTQSSQSSSADGLEAFLHRAPQNLAGSLLSKKLV